MADMLYVAAFLLGFLHADGAVLHTVEWLVLAG
jgi:hypothetical protein